jgi:hypothetical protein
LHVLRRILISSALQVVVLAWLVVPVPAPVPRCSPLIIINKLVEFNSLL